MNSDIPDFEIGVQDQIWEAPEGVRDLYRGIYQVIVNRGLSIAFVPAVTLQEGEPLVVPDDVDRITSPEEARRVCLFTASYAVVPDDQRAGTTLQVRTENASDAGCRVLFVEGHDFKRFSEELKAVHAELGSPWVTRRRSDLQDYDVVRFLVGQLASGQWLDDRARGVLD